MALLALAVIASAVVGAGASIVAGKKTEEAQEEQNEILSAQEKITDVATARRKIKEARVARARLLQNSEAAGTTGSSGEAGGLASLNTQLATNLADQTGQANTSRAISASNRSLAKSQFVAGTVGAIAGAAQSIFTQQALASAATPPVK